MRAGARAGERPARWWQSQGKREPSQYTFPLSGTSARGSAGRFACQRPRRLCMASCLTRTFWHSAVLVGWLSARPGHPRSPSADDNRPIAGPGGARSVVAESVFLKQQLLILNRPRKRAPNLRLTDRVVTGVCALLMRPTRLVRTAIVLKPATLFRLHRALKTRKYRMLFVHSTKEARAREGRAATWWPPWST